MRIGRSDHRELVALLHLGTDDLGCLDTELLDEARIDVELVADAARRSTSSCGGGKPG